MTTIPIPQGVQECLVADSVIQADIRAYDATMGDRGEGMPMEVFRRIIDGKNPVRVIREWRGLAQAELARKAGIHRVQVHDIETGKSRGRWIR